MSAGTIRVGIGGWDYEPWRETFYPPKLAKTKQLEHAAQHVTAIEINATYYKLQSPASYEKWAKAVPDGFKFALKGSRYCSNRRVLGEGGEGIERFCNQGFTELGDKLGPIVWQLMATKKFDPDDFRTFLSLLPREVAGVKLQHAVEPRHESFRDPAFVEMMRAAGVAIVFGDGEEFPCVPDMSGDLVYARLLGARSEEPQGYSPAELDRWAEVARGWAGGICPRDYPYSAEHQAAGPRDVYVFMINGAKERAPAAAMGLLERL
ncbi:DUF72 domain-containing protein [Allosphingosinicella deserti]|uniref:DUF72 domain-containing protein n=1 Tax=Allosphingosinicella deserti TaxID=2116704 RepID=A0A2P7QYF7_9SPHN|nr:DUF72 domain-containing protein [Sphingomonas deserti]PSJ42979.1 DUF72 domain-containing protein [Sphingomonas deserti]